MGVTEVEQATGVAAAFRRDDLQARFGRDGYLVLPFLDADGIAEARATFEAYHPNRSGQGFENDYYQLEPAERTAMAERLAPLRAPLEALLDDHDAYMTSFLMKWPGDGSAMDLHQDWTHVDESRFCSLTIWVALDDVDEDHDNGPLLVVPGSHRLDPDHRGSNTTPWFDDHRDELAAAARVVPLKAGEAVVLDSRVIHGSRPNRSDRLRLALAWATAPRQAQLLHPVDQGDGTVAIYAVDPTFWRDVHYDRMAEALAPYPVLETVPIRRRPFDDAELTAVCEAAAGTA